MSLFWSCTCGYKEWLHHETCGRCGTFAPPRDLPQASVTQKFVRHNSTPPPSAPVPDDVSSPNPDYYGY